MNNLNLLNKILDNVKSIDLAYLTAVGFWEDMMIYAEDKSRLKMFNCTRNEYFNKFSDEYMVIIKNHIFAKDYHKIFKNILDLRGNMRSFLYDNTEISKDMKMFICYDYLTRTDYEN